MEAGKDIRFLLNIIIKIKLIIKKVWIIFAYIPFISCSTGNWSYNPILIDPVMGDKSGSDGSFLNALVNINLSMSFIKPSILSAPIRASPSATW